MNKTLLLAATALTLVTVGAGVSIATPPHSATTVLWNQNSNFNPNARIISDNFTSGIYGSYDSTAADDFVVPARQKWSINEVDVTGTYSNGSCVVCSPTSETILFYKNKGGFPGAVIGTPQTIKCTEQPQGSFSCNLSPPMKLKGGTKGRHYWLGFVANMDFEEESNYWVWIENKTVHGHEAAWENPGNGFGSGCATWGTVGNCQGHPGDMAFDLKGKST
jgi:hypothetical protein